MYDKGEVIGRIGYELWDDFEIFILARDTEYDELGFEIYHPSDVAVFCKEHNIP